MGLKDNLTPLSGSELLDDVSVARLREWSITTVEELIGILDSDVSAVAALLDISTAELKEINRRALLLLDERHKAEFKAQEKISYPIGAFPPLGCQH